MSVVIITIRDDADLLGVTVDVDGDAVDVAAKTPAQVLADAACRGMLDAHGTAYVRTNHRSQSA